MSLWNIKKKIHWTSEKVIRTKERTIVRIIYFRNICLFLNFYSDKIITATIIFLSFQNNHNPNMGQKLLSLANFDVEFFFFNSLKWIFSSIKWLHAVSEAIAIKKSKQQQKKALITEWPHPPHTLNCHPMTSQIWFKILTELHCSIHLGLIWDGFFRRNFLGN